MHIGLAPLFQNLGKRLSDKHVYDQELAIARQAEPLGFDSVWSVEHHFTDYTMCPDVTQFLSYMAGCTNKIQLGSMVVVLPWHNPIRVAEEITMLDNLSDGRMILGIGRGLGRIEFEGMGVPMDESRGRFVEGAQMILEGLETGACEFDGEFFKQDRRDIRPSPFKSFRGRTFAAAVSPDSLPIMARLGIGLLVIPQKPWDTVKEDFEVYHRVWRQENETNRPPPAPMCGGFFFVDENADRAAELAHQYVGTYYHSVMEHYEMTAGHFAETKGYEFYSGIAKHIDKRGKDHAVDAFVNLMPWGTPDQVLEKLQFIYDTIGNQGVMCHFAFGGMDYDEADRNMNLFVKKVMPELRKMGGADGAIETEAA
jgi:alkanesulfonate monooxygenase SsuD/methylene tetrahydromethanopterin reductase-like flavin-dependent oxidoreductase (luciferase family)